tara:strand:+ start:375 stop:788 length:414 start_codon:yes stop_codon:yes gene_type:complete
MNKVSLRMKLSEFINTDYEPIIMDYIDLCHTKKPFFLNFWCKEGEIDVDTINRFADEHKSKLHIRTVIKSTATLEPNDFIWYDIIRPEDDLQMGDCRRFVHNYKSVEDLIGCLKSFSDCAVFCAGEKPKKQKRNDGQ